jgi:hypothetical protein
VFDGVVDARVGKLAAYQDTLAVAQGDAVDFVVGWGNGAHISDSTGLEVRLQTPSGKTYDAAKEFHGEQNPSGPWSYGHLKPGPIPDSETFRPYDRPGRPGQEGARLLNLANPAARQWLTDHIDNLLTEQGIDLYRQDFNSIRVSAWKG